MTDALFPDRTFSAILFDMDGTLLTSILSAERVWTAWARRHGLDVSALLANMHGMRASDTVRRQALAGIDEAAEVDWITRAEIEDVSDVAPIAGVAAFLAALPPTRWAIVTSASRELAAARLGAAGITLPAVMVTSEDVQRGKPAPDCFLLAAERLGVPISDCLVFEDAPAGIAAAEAAGATVVVVNATHAHPMVISHHQLAGYAHLQVTTDGAGIRVSARPA